MSGPELLVLDEPNQRAGPIVQQEFYALLREQTDTGGSVLASSHVLGEVQAGGRPDRSGPIGPADRGRADGRLREKSLHHFGARFADDVNAAEFAAVPGVRDLAVTGRAMTCSAPQAALDGLLKRITRHPVVDLDCAEAELEETFLAYYGTGEHHAA